MWNQSRMRQVGREAGEDRHPFVMSNATGCQEPVQPDGGRRYLTVDIGIQPRFPILKVGPASHKVDMPALAALAARRMAVSQPRRVDCQCSQRGGLF